MWPFKKKEVPKLEEKKPVKILVAMSITLVNNRTDKEYTIRSNNDHGLIPKVIDNGVRLRQRTAPPTDITNDDGKDDSWILVGSFTDFSVTAIEWKQIITNN